MLLKSPCLITGRLTAGIRVADAIISIEYAQGGDSGRTRYRYWIDRRATADGQPDDWNYTNNDIQSGCQGGDLREGMLSLLSFLGAAGEALAYSDHHGGPSENADLFPRHVSEWAAFNSDEISMAQLELEETSDAIVE